MFVAVANAWDRPLLGSYRTGTLALGIIGIAMCSLAGQVGKTRSLASPIILLATALGVAALGLAVAGLFTGSRTLFIVLAVDMLALWAISTLRHAVGRAPRHAIGT